MINVIEIKHVKFDEIYEEIKKFDKEAACCRCRLLCR